MANHLSGRSQAQREHAFEYTHSRPAETVVIVRPKAEPPATSWWCQSSREAFMRARDQQLERWKATTEWEIRKNQAGE